MYFCKIRKKDENVIIINTEIHKNENIDKI